MEWKKYKHRRILSKGTFVRLTDGTLACIDADDWECCESGFQELNYYIFKIGTTLEDLWIYFHYPPENYNDHRYVMINQQEVEEYGR